MAARTDPGGESGAVRPVLLQRRHLRRSWAGQLRRRQRLPRRGRRAPCASAARRLAGLGHVGTAHRRHGPCDRQGPGPYGPGRDAHPPYGGGATAVRRRGGVRASHARTDALRRRCGGTLRLRTSAAARTRASWPRFALEGPSTANGTAAAGASLTDGQELRRTLAAASPADRRRLLFDRVSRQVAVVLGYEELAGTGERELRDLGLDSLTAVELRNGLMAATGVRLPATVAFDHPASPSSPTSCSPNWSRTTTPRRPPSWRASTTWPGRWRPWTRAPPHAPGSPSASRHCSRSGRTPVARAGPARRRTPGHRGRRRTGAVRLHRRRVRHALTERRTAEELVP
ncbi:polyketide synthase [Streptomyces chrestomyceticus JCM 4735]|uniref:Polyketide synthase n=1 Tax=Streptomyces chrestomyceticus JCM 4735 TaxID=1306181 RepID=A0A7U9L513_9ACTN|nr:polyketide synthase [Streptomyces chrestomyceticus JCM 4735]